LASDGAIPIAPIVLVLKKPSEMLRHEIPASSVRHRPPPV
jgi:hypothetical protein